MPRYRRRMRGYARPVTQSFKKVIDIAPASEAVGAQAQNIALGVDSVAAGQTSAVDVNVPTGCKIKYIECHISYASLVNVATFCHWTLQKMHGGQVTVGANVVGGSNRRNQVFRQGIRSVGQNQNSDIVIRYKVPPAYQRMREGDLWVLVTNNSQIVTSVYQFIYKFFR